jgi:hypothetical protein
MLQCLPCTWCGVSRCCVEQRNIRTVIKAESYTQTGHGLHAMQVACRLKVVLQNICTPQYRSEYANDWIATFSPVGGSYFTMYRVRACFS